MITLFEKYSNVPDVNSLSTEFWKMVRLANWAKVVKTYKEQEEGESKPFMNAQARIYLKYEFKQIQKFYIEYQAFYIQLYDYFNPIWLNKKYNKFMPSDDGYSDLLSTIVGMGKNFAKMCIEDTDKFVEVARKEDFIENFGYLLQINEEEYWEIIEEFDPDNIRLAARKYNL